MTGSVEVMNIIMNDISPILLFLLESLTYFKEMLIFLGTYFAQILPAKFINAYVNGSTTVNV